MEDKRVLSYKTIFRIQGKLQRLAKLHLEQFNLSYAEFGIIRNLGENALTLSELSERMVRVNSNTTVAIDRLEAKGIVRREPDPKDRRATRVKLTEAGMKLWQEVLPKHDDYIRGLLSTLTDFEATALNALLEKIEKICDAGSSKR